jgi:predicted ATPase
MNDLQISLLGPPEIRWKDQLLSINRRIPRTLLFYLASRGNNIGREKLLTLFWEDAPESVSRRRLREALSRIRYGLPDSSILTTQADLVGLDYDKVDVDQLQFLNLVDLIGNGPWNTPLDKPLPDGIFQSLVQAVRLWHGTQFLEGADLTSTPQIDDWQLQTNQWLTPLSTRINERLSDHFKASGELGNSLKYAYKALESDNLNDGLHCKVLRLLVDMGQLEDARQYYSYVTNLLHKELNTHPSLQLVSIYQQIRKETQADDQTTKPEWQILSSVHTPFVGRQVDLEKLQIAVQAGGGTVISGESGLGKTRLVQEYCKQFARQRRILIAPCRQPEINLPFQPVIELLRNNIQSNEWHELSPVWVSHLAVLLPELVTLHPALNPPEITNDSDQNRSAIFEAIRQVFDLVAKKNDIIIFFDDAHWADEATLSTISYLIERPPFDQRAVIILASRPDDLKKNLENIFPSPHTSLNITNIKLERLNLRDISNLGRYVLGFPLEKEFVGQLADETGGNPFIILETLRVIQDQETGFIQSKQSQLPMAESVYSLIQNRINRLSPLARETIELAAVIGTEFCPELISLSSHQSLSVIARAIEELIQRNFIESIERTAQDISYRFIHDKIREALLQETNPVRLRFLNKQIAQAMESSIGPQPESQAAVLAQHYEDAGELPAAIKYWLLAAQWARKLFSTSEAGQIFAHTEQLILMGNSNISDELIHNFYADWTEMAFEINEVEAIQSQNNNLLSLGRNRRSPLLIGTAFDGLSDACLSNNQFDEGLAYTNQAISYINQTEDTFEKMNAYIHRGVFLYMLGRINDAMLSFEQALDLSHESDNLQITNTTANAHYQLALTQILSGWPERGLKNALHSLTLANEIGHNHTAVTAYMASSLARYYLADYEEANQDNQLGIEMAKRIRAERMLGYLHSIQGFLEIANGNLDQAYHSAQLVSKLGEKNQLGELISISCRIQGDIFLSLGKPEEAAAIYQEGVGIGGQSFWGLDNLIRLGFAQIRDGQLEIGMHNLHRGKDMAQSGGLEIITMVGDLFLCYAHADLGEWGQVRQIAHPLERKSRKRSLQVIRIMSLIVLGMLEMNTGDQQESLTYLQQAQDNSIELHDPLLELRSVIPITKILNQSGRETKINIQRINEIIEQLECNAQVEPVCSAMLAFKNNLLTKL